MNASNERRANTRTDSDVPVKVHDPRTRRYRGGKAINLSTGGALIEVAAGAPLHPGDRVAMFIDTTGRKAVVRQEDLVPAIALRVLNKGDKHVVAVRFAQPQRVAKAA